MDGLIVLVFDFVPDDSVQKLVNDLLEGASIHDIWHSELGEICPSKDYLNLFPLIKFESKPSSIFIKAANATIGDVAFCNVLVRILRFQETNEIDFIFDRFDIDEINTPKDIIAKLQEGATKIACKASVTEYFCGFEPATCNDTRFFTRTNLAPLLEI